MKKFQILTVIMAAMVFVGAKANTENVNFYGNVTTLSCCE